MDAKEQLFLSEGVCRQLGIITYHPDVEPRKATKLPEGGQSSPKDSARVPTVRVKLVQSKCLPPNHSVVAEACLTDCGGYSGPLLIEPNDALESEQEFKVVDSLVATSDKSTVRVMLANCSGLAQKVETGMEVGIAVPAEVVDSVESADHSDSES